MHRYRNLLGLSRQSLKRRFTDGSQNAISDRLQVTENLLNIQHNSSDTIFEHTLQPSSSENQSDSNSNSFNTSSIENHSNDEERAPIDEFLRCWANEFQVKQNCLNSLLKYLKTDYPNLPSDSRTLLRTPKSRRVMNIAPGKYIHIGIRNNLETHLNNFELDKLPKELQLDFNIDGLPISKSSNSCFWLILCRIVGVDNDIFPVGVYHGYSKPENFDLFLTPLVDELEIITNSFMHKEKSVKIKIRAIVCDAPARAACTGVKGHTGYHSCHKCTLEGEYVENRVIFSGRGNARTDVSFRNRVDMDHHISTSPFERLNIDMVEQFPHDYLHVVLLGVMRKLIRMWISGGTYSLLPSRQTAKISRRLENLVKTQPPEFQRKTRKISEINYFKGSELRTFVLYTGPFVLKNILPNDKYEHFLLLHNAIRILCSNEYKHLTDLSKTLLDTFVEDYEILYGTKNMTYNVHSLLHIVEDVKKFGCLDEYSAFQFESYMYCIKRMLRKHNEPLSQIANRLAEKTLSNPNKLTKKTTQKFPILKQKTIQNNHETFKTVICPSFKISSSLKNKWIMSKNKDVIEFFYARAINNEFYIFGKMMEEKYNFYETPLRSDVFDIYATTSTQSELLSWKLEDIDKKLFFMKSEDLNFNVYFPLLHTH